VTAGAKSDAATTDQTEVEKRLASIDDKLYRIEEFMIQLQPYLPLLSRAQQILNNPATMWRRNRG
jgi:hypothetical protein